VSDIGKELWLHYDDRRESRLNTTDLTDDEVDLLHRCIAFLESNEEYLPVNYEEPGSRKPAWLRRLSGTRNATWESKHMVISPDRAAVWPCADQSQCQRVMDGYKRHLRRCSKPERFD
jgi:hypothetical protein